MTANQENPMGNNTAAARAPQKLDKFTLFGSFDTGPSEINLAGGNLTSIFSSGKIDLRAAQLAEQEVKLELFGLFSSLELRVPASWHIEANVTPILGSVEERGVAPLPASHAPTLRISGVVMFASLEIERF